MSEMRTIESIAAAQVEALMTVANEVFDTGLPTECARYIEAQAARIHLAHGRAGSIPCLDNELSGVCADRPPHAHGPECGSECFCQVPSNY